MSKLLKLKDYFALEEAVEYLSSALEETVNLSDIYRLALEKKLSLSARLINQAYALGGRYIDAVSCDSNHYQVERDLTTNEVLAEPYTICLSNELQVEQSKWLVFDKKIHVLNGILDLAMIGFESQEIKELYQKEINGTKPVLNNVNGFFLKQGELIYKLKNNLPMSTEHGNLDVLQVRLNSLLISKGLTVNDVINYGHNMILDCLDDAELDEFMLLIDAIIRHESNEQDCSDKNVPLDALNYQLVIRTSEITRFVQSLEEQPTQSKASETNYTNSILCLLAAVLKENNYDWNQRGITTSLVVMTEKLSAPLSGDTIRKILSNINSAVESRSK